MGFWGISSWRLFAIGAEDLLQIGAKDSLQIDAKVDSDKNFI